MVARSLHRVLPQIGATAVFVQVDLDTLFAVRGMIQAHAGALNLAVFEKVWERASFEATPRRSSVWRVAPGEPGAAPRLLPSSDA